MDNNEIITQTYFWFNKSGEKYTFSDVEYEALRLCKLSKVILLDIKFEENSDKDGYNYYIVSEGTKQKLLLLKHIMDAWIMGAQFYHKTSAQNV